MRATLLRLALLLGSASAQAPVNDNLLDEPSISPSPPRLAAASAAAGAASVKQTCKYTAAGGLHYDLSPMFQHDHDFTGTTTGGYAYRFNVCGNTVKVCNQQPGPASKWRGTKCNNLGDASTQTLSLLDPAKPADGLKLQFTQGDICKMQSSGGTDISSRKVNYEVHCDYGKSPGELRYIQEVSMCEYTIVFDSRYACPTNGGSGHGWSIVFFLLFGAATYVGVGMYLNQQNEGKHGVEAIPHLEYWQQVPGLVTDGAIYSYEKGKVAMEHVAPHAAVLADTVTEKGKLLYATVKEKYGGQPPGI